MDLVEEVYRRTDSFPDSEKYELTIQMMLFLLPSSPFSHLSSPITLYYSNELQ